MSDTLKRICADKRTHIDTKMRQKSLFELQKEIEGMAPSHGFIKKIQVQETALIAEVKKASPSKGVIRADFDPVAIAHIYEQNGAACLSVLTDEPYFQGHDDYFMAVRAATTLPLLRKDFMIDAYQIYESRALGADCVLLIMACLSDAQAREFYDLAESLGMDVLVEVHDEDELERGLALAPAMIGVNNRNLKTLKVDLQNGLDLAAKVPEHIVKVAESGIYQQEHIKMYKAADFRAFLVGESLMREDDIAAAVKNLMQS